MLKTTLLSTLLMTATFATAHINLNLDIRKIHENTQRQLAYSLIIEENVPTSITIDDIEVEFIAQSNDAMVNLEIQLIENDEIITETDPILLDIPFNQQGTISIQDSDDNTLLLMITPTVL